MGFFLGCLVGLAIGLTIGFIVLRLVGSTVRLPF